MKYFYYFWMMLGLIGTVCIFYLLTKYAPLWTLWISIPSFVAVEFGAFAQRDMKYELGVE